MFDHEVGHLRLEFDGVWRRWYGGRVPGTHLSQAEPPR